jgi:hypothetical protein
LAVKVTAEALAPQKELLLVAEILVVHTTPLQDTFCVVAPVLAFDTFSLLYVPAVNPDFKRT